MNWLRFPRPPIYAVIFTSRRASQHEGYGEMEAQRLGRRAWYDECVVRVARVERVHPFDRAGD